MRTVRRAPLLALLLAACGAEPAGVSASDGRAPATPVEVATASRADVPREIRAVGTVQPLASVVVKPQVEGMLVEVLFEEGADVRAGDVLVRIDPRPFEAAVLGARADLLRDQALAQDARAASEQLQGALDRSAVSKRAAEQAAAAAAAAEAQVEKDRAALQTAELELERCTLRAPFDARTGKLETRRGSVVKANETEIVRLHQIRPIRVEFSVPEIHLPEIRAAAAGGPLAVGAQPPGAEAVEGELSFLDNEVDRSTGTIRLMATFANEDRGLWPGQFAQVLLRTGVDREVVLVPSAAIQVGQEGDFVFVVGADSRVEVRPVRVARVRAGSSVLAEGLDGGETVVTEGQLRLVPGARVEPKPADAGRGR